MRARFSDIPPAAYLTFSELSELSPRNLSGKAVRVRFSDILISDIFGTFGTRHATPNNPVVFAVLAFGLLLLATSSGPAVKSYFKIEI